MIIQKAKVEYIMKVKRLSYKKLASITGYKYCTLWRYISGARPMSNKIKSKIARILNADEEWLFSNIAFNIPPYEGGEEGDG